MAAKSVFGLVPGAGHGAWCWQRLIGALDALGYRSIALDLPCEDAAAGADAYARAVLDSVSEIGDELVLMGHSLGGLTIPLVAEARPLRKLVFLAGVFPIPGLSLMEQRAREPEMVFANPGGAAALRMRYYNRATDADAAWALAQLRAQSQTPYIEVTPLTTWPSVEVESIVPLDDRTVNPEWGLRVAAERFGIRPHTMPEADHSPFLSRPADLARLLVQAAG